MADNSINWLISATDQASPVFRGIQTSMERLKVSYGQLGAVLGGAGIAGGLVSMLKGAIDTGDQLNKMSQKVGISVESLSQLKFGAELADVSVEAMGTGLKKFNGALVEATNPTTKMAAVFKALGVDVRAGPEQAFKQFATAVSQLADGELKTTLATQVLGRAGMELIPWLNAGGKGMEDAAESAKKLGIVMSADTARAAEELNDNLKKLHAGAQALGLGLANQTAGGMATLTGNLVKAKEEGNLFLGILKEMAKVLLALGSKIPGGMGELIGMGADKMFSERGDKAPPVSGLIRRSYAHTDGPIGVDQDALARALSGQKDPKDDSAKRLQDWMLELDKASMKRIEMADKEAEEKLKAEEKFLEGLSKGAQVRQEMEEKLAADHLKKQADFDELMEKAAMKRMQMQDEAERAAEEAAKKTSSTMKDLGFVMSSSFESAALAILGLTDRMASARDVARGLLADLAKVILRKGVTDPLAEAATSAIGPFIKGLFGAKAEGGPVMGGGSYLVGERGPEIFTPSSSGNITPNHALGGNTIINVTYNPSAAGGAADAQSMAASLIPMIRSVVRGEITTQFRPGGVFA